MYISVTFSVLFSQLLNQIDLRQGPYLSIIEFFSEVHLTALNQKL